MRCDFEQRGEMLICIRCSTMMDPHFGNYRTCLKRGFGDWLYLILPKFHLFDCRCSQRRSLFNEWDRKLYRKYWEFMKWLRFR